MTDSSTASAALIDTGLTGGWAESVIARDALAAPHLMPVEVANIHRRRAGYKTQHKAAGTAPEVLVPAARGLL